MANLASALIIVVTTGASLLYVLKRSHLDGRQNLIVLLLATLAGVPVGSVLFVLLSLVGIILYLGYRDRERRGNSVLLGADGRSVELDACPDSQHRQRRRSRRIGDGHAGHVRDRPAGNTGGGQSGNIRSGDVRDGRSGSAGHRPTVADRDNRRRGVLPSHRSGDRRRFLLVGHRPADFARHVGGALCSADGDGCCHHRSLLAVSDPTSALAGCHRNPTNQQPQSRETPGPQHSQYHPVLPVHQSNLNS